MFLRPSPRLAGYARRKFDVHRKWDKILDNNMAVYVCILTQYQSKKMHLCDLFLKISPEILNSFPRLAGSQENKAALPSPITRFWAKNLNQFHHPLLSNRLFVCMNDQLPIFIFFIRPSTCTYMSFSLPLCMFFLGFSVCQCKNKSLVGFDIIIATL